MFVLEAAEDELERRRPRVWMPEVVAQRRPGELREIRVHGPSPPSVPSTTGHRSSTSRAPTCWELVVGAGCSARPVTDGLVIRW